MLTAQETDVVHNLPSCLCSEPKMVYDNTQLTALDDMQITMMLTHGDAASNKCSESEAEQVHITQPNTLTTKQLQSPHVLPSIGHTFAHPWCNIPAWCYSFTQTHS